MPNVTFDVNTILALLVLWYTIRCIYLYSIKKLEILGKPLCTVHSYAPAGGLDEAQTN